MSDDFYGNEKSAVILKAGTLRIDPNTSPLPFPACEMVSLVLVSSKVVMMYLRYGQLALIFIDLLEQEGEFLLKLPRLPNRLKCIRFQLQKV